MKIKIIKFVFLGCLFLGLPLLGVLITDRPLALYFEFPPKTKYIDHAPFSWMIFFLIGGFTLTIITPLLFRVLRLLRRSLSSIFYPQSSSPFPWWGWLGLLTGICFWILAWNRFPWFSVFQPHTFTPLWLPYILVINALADRRSGRCLIRNQTHFFLCLFPLSAGFWWFFEYLNRFVQNWHYLGIENFSAWEYFLYSTISYSTVLPAVISTQEWLSTFSIFDRLATKRPHSARAATASDQNLGWLLFLFSAGGLAWVGVYPDYLFPLLWISPLLIMISFQMISGTPHLFSKVAEGDWRNIVTSSLAALICGFFWEMWNYYSQAKWIYTIPYVNRFHLFEMPILGYAGYLPFGIICAITTEFLVNDDQKYFDRIKK